MSKLNSITEMVEASAGETQKRGRQLIKELKAWEKQESVMRQKFDKLTVQRDTYRRTIQEGGDADTLFALTEQMNKVSIERNALEQQHQDLKVRGQQLQARLDSWVTNQRRAHDKLAEIASERAYLDQLEELTRRQLAGEKNLPKAKLGALSLRYHDQIQRLQGARK
jgi:chromosome segregation ATPase